MSRKVNIFACGGFGQNTMMGMMTREFFPSMAKHLKLFALDTSPANLRKYEEQDLAGAVSIHLVPNADGSGSFRGENIDAIVTMVGELVNSGTIEDGICVVISSASGGSGAVIAAELMTELAKRGRSVFGMTLETDEDDIKVNNTLKSVKTFKHKAETSGHHLTTFWRHNRNEDGRIQKAAANAAFQEALENIIAIGHPDMDALDTKDVHHFLNYPFNQNVPGEMRFLTIRHRRADEQFPEEQDVPLAILSLLNSDVIDPDYPRGVGYTTHGVLPRTLSFTDDRVETQFLIHSGRLAKLANHLETTIAEFNKIQKLDKERQSGNDIRSSGAEDVSSSGQFI